jgi:ribosomal protein S18 acetylase RimI-like enzyme
MTTIRKAKPDDTPQLEVLYQRTCRETFTSRPQDTFQMGDYAKSVREDEVWVAEEHGKIIGFVSTYPADNFVHNLFVYSEHQGRGIGSSLMQRAEANLARPMTLKIAMDNLDVCAFYEKQGWSQVSVHEDAIEPYLLYRKSK